MSRILTPLFAWRLETHEKDDSWLPRVRTAAPSLGSAKFTSAGKPSGRSPRADNSAAPTARITLYQGSSSKNELYMCVPWAVYIGSLYLCSGTKLRFPSFFFFSRKGWSSLCSERFPGPKEENEIQRARQILMNPATEIQFQSNGTSRSNITNCAFVRQVFLVDVFYNFKRVVLCPVYFFFCLNLIYYDIKYISRRLVLAPIWKSGLRCTVRSRQ